MADMYAVPGETLTGIANAIRSKTGSDEQMPVSAMAAAIEGISGGGGSGKDFFVPVAYCHGKFSFDGDAQSSQYLYFSIPDAYILKIAYFNGVGGGRIIYSGDIIFTGGNNGNLVQRVENLIIPRNTSIFANRYTGAGVYVGQHENGQHVVKAPFVIQSVSFGTTHIDFAFYVLMPKTGVPTVQYYDDCIDFGNIELEKWHDLGGHGSLYLGYTNPIE